MKGRVAIGALAIVSALCLTGGASVSGPQVSGIMQTVGATSVTYPISIPQNGACAFFLEVVEYDISGSFVGSYGYTFKNMGAKNVGGTVTTSSLAANLLSIGTVDTGLLASTVAVSTGAGTVIVTDTGIAGETINWQNFWTEKCMQP